MMTTDRSRNATLATAQRLYPADRVEFRESTLRCRRARHDATVVRNSQIVLATIALLLCGLAVGCGVLAGDACSSGCAPGQVCGPNGCVPATITGVSDAATVLPAGAQCGPSTCASGCCDAASGSCVLSTQQTATGKCGFGGQVCGPCAGTNPQPGTLPAYCAACTPGQPGAQLQCCHAAQQACVPATQVQSTVTGTWCSAPSGSTSPGSQADALARCQSSCGGCCTDAGQCVELGVGKGQSNQRCGSGAGRCEACQYGEVCDATYGTCNRPEPAFRVCVRQVVVDGSYEDDEWADAFIQGQFRTKAQPEFIATLIAGGKTPKLGTRVQAIKRDGVWVSTPMGLDCVSGIKESELLEGLGSGVSILVTEYDRVSASDTVGHCAFAVSALDVFGGAVEVWIDSCIPPVRGVLVQIVPENL